MTTHIHIDMSLFNIIMKLKYVFYYYEQEENKLMK